KTLNVISNLFVENVNISGQKFVGGIAGFAQYTVFDSCYVSGGTIEGSSNVGGFIGYAATSAIKDCYAKVSVTANENYGGGFIGVYDTNESGVVLISYCYARGNVTGNGTNGGFVGYNNSKIRSAYTVTTSISGDTLGLFCGKSSTVGEFINCYFCNSYNASVTGIGNLEDNENDVYGVASAGLKQINQISNLNGSDAYVHWERDLQPFINDGFPIHIWQGDYLGVNISSYNNLTLSIFPNPVKNTLNIKFENINILKVEIVDLLGKPIISRHADFESIDVNNLKSGIYFLKLHTDKETITKKFIKQ
ncbi:MAG: T9SS type A sorting domain-containing protein, partial [Bacteroidales bacterium]|nr:T9SS type A sorting domain-containing protein [Bacteroidales bacterium]